MLKFDNALSLKLPQARYWVKVLRAEEALPLPADVSKATDIRVAPLVERDVELSPSDVLIEAENVHRGPDSAWRYMVIAITPRGEVLSRFDDWGKFKSEMRAEGGFDPVLLGGSGPLAACVRFAHIARLGGLRDLRARMQAALAMEAISSVEKVIGTANESDSEGESESGVSALRRQNREE